MIATRSVRLKIVLGFVAVIAPLVAFLFYNNYYAMSVVRDQVSTNYSNMLDLYVRNTDNVMHEVNLYLYRMETDPDVSILYSYGYGSDEYVLTKLRILNKLNSGIGYYYMLNAVFVYSREYDDLILSAQGAYTDSYNMIRARLPDIIAAKTKSDYDKWLLVRNGAHYALVQIYEITPNVLAGAWINVDNLSSPLGSWDLGPGGGIILDTKNGMVGSNAFTQEQYQAMQDNVVASGQMYRVVQNPAGDSRYLLVDRKSDLSPLRFVLAVSEKNMLKNLPYFQRGVYVIPLVGVIAVVLYLIFLQRVFFRPLAELIRGMRRIGQGRLDFRLQDSGSSEFNFMVKTFNDMVEQIDKLKIDVYEEQLKVQQAEFRHLQVQINPHFFMNSLNIVYNLAALKDVKSIQKMALYLADYFRFTIRTDRTIVTLAEELRHVRNYLEIQQMRYPDNLRFAIDVPEKYGAYPVPSLSIQPFVENCIIHGMNHRDQVFTITIAAEADEREPERFFAVRIADTGKGFPAEILERLQGGAWMSVSGGDHLGIWNVIRRLKMHLGEEAEVLFDNSGQGAVVLLRLPDHPNHPDQEGRENA